MASPCVLHLYADKEAQIEKAANLAINEIRRFEKKFSRYQKDSVVSKINSNAGKESPVKLDEETQGLINYADVAWQQSGGVFDITSGCLRKIWRFKEQKIPTQGQITNSLALIGWEKVLWEPPFLSLPIPGMEIDLGGIGKEYAADMLATLCLQAGIKHGLVDLGGDLAVIVAIRMDLLGESALGIHLKLTRPNTPLSLVLGA